MKPVTSKEQTKRLALWLVIPLVLGACSFLGERGSGTVITETRDVSGFTGVELRGSGRVELSDTGTESLTIEAEDNILPLLSTEVVGGILVLRATESISPTRDIVYTITAQSFESFELSGSGSLDALDLDGGPFDIAISGSGSAAVAGSVSEIDVSISGSGSFDGEDLLATGANVSISGSGSAIVNAASRLEVAISGSGSVEYIGDPAVSSSISGSGDISQR